MKSLYREISMGSPLAKHALQPNFQDNTHLDIKKYINTFDWLHFLSTSKTLFFLEYLSDL